MLDLNTAQWVLMIFAAFLVGFSKMGISGLMMLVIPIFAGIFGGKESTGMILPLLIIGDIMAVVYYHQHTEWNNIAKLMPWTMVGLFAGIVVGNYVNDNQFKMLIAISVLICVGILIYTELKKSALQVPNQLWFYALTGIASGFATMIGNAAGPVMSVYLLAMGFRKNDFLGTYAWFFFIINVIKVPLQMFFWQNIRIPHLVTAFSLSPAVLAGALLGSYVIKKIDERPFRYMIICMTAFAAVNLLV